MDEVRTEDRPLWRLEGKAVEVGVVGGLLGGVAMGVLLHLGTGLLPVLGAFLGERSALLGWIVHLFVAVAYGVAYAAIVTYPPVGDLLDAPGVAEQVLVGVTYAVMIAAVSIAILPFVFELPWAAAAIDEPLRGIPGPGQSGLLPAGAFAVAHVVYGAVLGAAYAVLADPAAAGERGQ